MVFPTDCPRPGVVGGWAGRQAARALVLLLLLSCLIEYGWSAGCRTAGILPAWLGDATRFVSATFFVLLFSFLVYLLCMCSLWCHSFARFLAQPGAFSLLHSGEYLIGGCLSR